MTSLLLGGKASLKKCDIQLYNEDILINKNKGIVEDVAEHRCSHIPHYALPLK
jgi:hypothetical protein